MKYYEQKPYDDESWKNSSIPYFTGKALFYRILLYDFADMVGGAIAPLLYGVFVSSLTKSKQNLYIATP